jgi:hypothetical protein
MEVDSGSPVWSHEGMYALANAHKHKVKLTFHHGAQLPDPRKLFNAGLDGKKWRAIDFREGDKIDKTALKALLREAVAYATSGATSERTHSGIRGGASPISTLDWSVISGARTRGSGCDGRSTIIIQSTTRLETPRRLRR